MAAACPHCGHPVPKAETSDGNGATFVTALLAVAVVVGLLYKCGTMSDQISDREVQAAAECRKTLQCWGDKALSSAGAYCERDIERLAKYSVKWVEGTFEPRFSRFRWLDREQGTLTFVGDRVLFQNGFGAFEPTIYECDFDPTTKTVLDARAMTGRLP